MRLSTLPLLPLAFALTACGSDSTGTALLHPEFSLAPVAGIAVSTTIATDRVAPGDTVRFVVTATNQTGERIEVGGSPCGPGMDVAIRHPGGETERLLEGLVFTCEARPEQVFGPGQSHTLGFSWVAPAAKGEYIAVAGLRRSGGLSNPSSPVRFTVR